MHKEKSVFSCEQGTHTDECVRRSKSNLDVWNVNQVFCKYRHVLYDVFPVIIAVHRRILMLFFAHPEQAENTSMCSGENTGRAPICYLGILKVFWACPNYLECCVLLI